MLRLWKWSTGISVVQLVAFLAGLSAWSAFTGSLLVLVASVLIRGWVAADHMQSREWACDDELAITNVCNSAIFAALSPTCALGVTHFFGTSFQVMEMAVILSACCLALALSLASCAADFVHGFERDLRHSYCEWSAEHDRYARIAMPLFIGTIAGVEVWLRRRFVKLFGGTDFNRILG